jgi:2-polyprenyl-3-methyl-5-hydroxy-6-metoxy-1,4-benzoquinol methylase
MYKQLKEAQYRFRMGLFHIFSYPKETIDIDKSQDYDEYWVEKRGDAIGYLSDWQRDRAELVLRLLSKEPSVSIGDIGCGEGSILKYIMDRREVSLAIGYDSSRFVLDKAEKIGIEGIEMNVNDAEDHSKLKTVDYTLILEVLEHIPESERLLRAAYQTSTKGVFISFPNTGYFIYRLRLLFGKFPKQWVTFPNEHLRFWTRTDVKWWLKAQGYEQYDIQTYRGIPVLNRIFPNLFGAGLLVLVKK